MSLEMREDCERCGIALAGYPAVRAWIDRVAAQPKHIPITQG